MLWNVKTALQECGCGFEHVVKITNYFANMDDLPIFFKIRDSYVNTKAPPASRAVQVGRLALPKAVFELEAVAVVPLS
jgi:enamine deaminase RidA (YjgF/YER057c/UK114 family)